MHGAMLVTMITDVRSNGAYKGGLGPEAEPSGLALIPA